MNKYLQDYFNVAKQQQVVFNETEIGYILQKNARTKGKKNLLTTHRLVLIGSLGILLAILFFIEPHMDKTLDGFKLKKTIALPPPAANSKQAKEPEALKKHSSPPALPHQPILGDTLPKLTTNEGTYIESTPLLNHLIVNNNQESVHSYFNAENQLILTFEELIDLGIHTDGQTLNYSVQTDSFKTMIWEKDTTREAFMFSINIEKHGSTSTDKISGDSLKLKDTKSFWALALHQQSKAQKSTLTIIDQFFNRGYELDYFNEAKQDLIPVYIFLKAQPGKYSHDNELIFWFKNEHPFIANLPIGAQKECLQKFGPPKNSSYFLTLRDKYRAVNNSKYRTKGFDSISVAEFKKRYLHLSDRALKKLNITKTKESLKLYYYESDSNKHKTKLVYRKVRYIQKKNFTDIRHGIISLKSKKKAAALLAVSPIAVSDYNISSIDFLRHYQDSIGPFLNNPSYTKFKTLIPNLYPIYIDSSHIFWIEKNMRTARIIQESKYENEGIKLKKIHLTTLNEHELKQLGITYKDKGVSLPLNLSAENETFAYYKKQESTYEFKTFTPVSDSTTKRSTHTDEGVHMPPTISSNNAQTIYKIPTPVLVTSLDGLEWKSYELRIEDFLPKETNTLSKNNLELQKEEARKKALDALNKQISTLFPIAIKHPILKNVGVIAWYKTDSLLLNLLPKPIGKELQEEALAINNDNTTTNCIYFEACNYSAVSYQLTAYPNPVSDLLNLTIETTIKDDFTITLTDINAKVVKELKRKSTFNTGNHNFNLDLSSITPGIYLLQVTNAQGDKTIRRIIKK